MRIRPTAKARAAAFAVATWCALVITQGEAVERFRVVYRVDRQATVILVSGTLFNEDTRDVVDVWVTAKALDASGKAKATGIAYVASSLYGHGSVSFVVKVPVVEGIRDFDVAVSSFRDSGSLQSP